MRLTTHLRVAAKLRISGAVPLLLLYAFLARKKATLPLPLPLPLPLLYYVQCLCILMP
jgi:hypothetical protein